LLKIKLMSTLPMVSDVTAYLTAEALNLKSSVLYVTQKNPPVLRDIAICNIRDIFVSDACISFMDFSRLLN